MKSELSHALRSRRMDCAIPLSKSPSRFSCAIYLPEPPLTVDCAMWLPEPKMADCSDLVPEYFLDSSGNFRKRFP